MGRAEILLLQASKVESCKAKGMHEFILLLNTQKIFRDRNFSFSATLVAAVAPVASIAEVCVSLNTFFDDSGGSSDGSDYMETGFKASP